MDKPCADKAETVRHMVILIENHMLQVQQQIRDSRQTLELIRDIIGYHDESPVLDRMDLADKMAGDVVYFARQFLHHQLIGLRDPLEVLNDLRGSMTCEEPPVRED